MSSIINGLSSAVSTIASMPGQAVTAFNRSSTTTKVLVVTGVALGLAAVAAATTLDPTTSSLGDCLSLLDKQVFAVKAFDNCEFIKVKNALPLCKNFEDYSVVREAEDALHASCYSFLYDFTSFIPHCVFWRAQLAGAECHYRLWRGITSATDYEAKLPIYAARRTYEALGCNLLGNSTLCFMGNLFHS